MLDEFLSKLSDEAQLQIAVRLIREAMPVWKNHLAQHPDDLEKINALIGPENKIAGAVGCIDADLPTRYLIKLEACYAASKNANDRPIPAMKADILLQPLFATIMQPITHAAWDTTLPYTVRLVYTSVWNILTWLLFRRSNDSGETHICVAINQAADALMTEKLKTVEEINAILSEYAEQKRADDEDAAWANVSAPQGQGGGFSTNEIYRKISGENIVKDAPKDVQVSEILRQMRDEGKSYWDEWYEYIEGTSRTFSYNKEKQSYWMIEIDVIVASFCNEYAWSEQQMRDYLTSVSLNELRKNGFEI